MVTKTRALRIARLEIQILNKNIKQVSNGLVALNRAGYVWLDRNGYVGERLWTHPKDKEKLEDENEFDID